VFDHIKTYYKCYEIAKNGILHVHTLLLLKDSLDPNTLIQLLHDHEEFQESIINYLNDIIIQNIDKYKSFNETTHENNGENNENIHPCTTRPINTNANNFHELFNKDIYKLMNLRNRHMCSLTCYKSNVDASKKFCKYGFLQTLVDKTHFDDDTKLLHIK
jgi:hypothetical protein